MGIWEIVVGAIVLILSIVMIIVIVFQEGHDSGLGTITGGADSFMGRGKAKTADALFAKITKYLAIIFFVCVVLLNALSYFGLTGKPNDNAPVTETSQTTEESVSEEGSVVSDETSGEAVSAASEQTSGEAVSAASEQTSGEAVSAASEQTSSEVVSTASEQTSAEAVSEQVSAAE